MKKFIVAFVLMTFTFFGMVSCTSESKEACKEECKKECCSEEDKKEACAADCKKACCATESKKECKRTCDHAELDSATCAAKCKGKSKEECEKSCTDSKKTEPSDSIGTETNEAAEEVIEEATH